METNNDAALSLFTQQFLESVAGLPADAAAKRLWAAPDGGWQGVDVDEALSFKTNDRIRDACRLLCDLRRQHGSDQQAWTRSKQQVDKILRVFYYAQHALYAQAHLETALRAVRNPSPPSDDGAEQDRGVPPCLAMSHFETLTDDPKATTGFQKLLLYLLYQAYHHRLRKCGEHCYRKIITPDGHDTHAWEPCFSIRDFIYDMTNKEFNFDMWNHLTRVRGNLDAAAAYLSTCRDPQFPHIVKRRDMFSFRNGIYLARTDRFVPYASDERLPEHWTASKYFDAHFEPHACADWYDIPTPAMQQIMECQEFPEDACRWLYAFIGRMIYALNDLDKWQVIPFLQGQAATGKSTILMFVCKNMYDRVDVGVLSNNIEKKFGLSAFVDKHVFIAPEVRNDLGLDQAEFQSMVSGEDMSVARKFGTAEQVQWAVPGILAGNQVPNWSDSARSIARRLVVWEFTKRPENPDTTLGDRLVAEMPAILLKCNRAYHAALRRVGRDNVAKHLPDYFKSTTALLVDEVDSLRNMLDSGKLRYGPDCYMRFSEFVKIYNNHCRENGFKQERVNKTSYVAPFLERGAAVLMNATREWPKESGCMVNDKWIVGLEANRSDLSA